MSDRIESFEDLKVYQKSFLLLQQKIFLRTKQFPKEERYSLTDQIRRASRSVGANIAEAWQKRLYPAHFINKLSDADGEQSEVRHWLSTALECGYLTEEDTGILRSQAEEIGRMLGKMMAQPEKWCGRLVQ